MKNLVFILFLSSFFLISCNKTATENPVQPVFISADKFGIFSDGKDAISFTAKLADNTDVTSGAEFYVNDTKITGHTFVSTAAGDYTASVLYNGVKSTNMSFGIVDKVESPSSYSTKLLVEDFTGTWCGWCPRVAYKLEEAVNANNKIIPVGVHYNDGMTYTFVNQMMTKYGITGFPTALLNRNTKWSENPMDLENALGNLARIGLAISSQINGNVLDVNVKVGFTLTTTTQLKLVVYLVEDGIVEDQANYMNDEPGGGWYQAGAPIVGFEHKHVLRSALTDIFGDPIPQYVTLARNTYSKDLSINISNYNPNKIHVVAFVLSDATSNYVYNTQIAKAGTAVGFD